MAAPIRQPYFTVEEYFDYDNNSQIRHEYIEGQIVAMSGGSPEHDVIKGEIEGLLRRQLRGRPCRVHSSDMRIEIEADTTYTYPDVSVVCGEPIYKRDKGSRLLNPTVIIEVLSPSTANYDRGDKFAYYRGIESVQEYLLVSQDKPQVEHYVRQEDGWLLTVALGLGAIVHLPSIDCDLTLAEVYFGLEFGRSVEQVAET